MLNSHASNQRFKDKEIDIEIMGNWADNYNSWKNYKGRSFLIIKYEDLVAKKEVEFLKILNYLKDLVKIEVNINQMKKSIEDTSFEKLKRQEEIHGFDQATGNGPFRKGIVETGEIHLAMNKLQKLKNLF